MSTDSTRRNCGECSACCTTHSVKKLKGAFSPCHNLLSEGGCAIYAHRPSPCRHFVCGWLAGEVGTDEERPDIVGLVPGRILSGERKVALLEYFEGAAEQTIARSFIAELEAKGHGVIVHLFNQSIPERANPFDLLD